MTHLGDVEIEHGRRRHDALPYDAAERLTRATLPGGASVSYGYDAAERRDRLPIPRRRPARRGSGDD